MKIYINGDSHAAAAEAVCPHAFAEDDGALLYMGRAPHPANLAVSFGKCLADMLKAVHHTDAESASSNTRILRTSRKWVEHNRAWLPETVMIIQWSTWEREEWILDGVAYQVTASGTDDVPPQYHERYKTFIANLDWQQCTEQQHRDIWQFHEELCDLGVRHVFFNGNNHFQAIAPADRRDWGAGYITPYECQGTFHSWCQQQGLHTAYPSRWHYGPDAHAAWARFLRQYLVANKLI